MWKKCSNCKKIKPFYLFCKGTGKFRLNAQCKICKALYDKNNYIENKDKFKKRYNEQYYRRTYGISREEKYLLLEEQENKCLICKMELNEKDKACVDHNHKNNKIRGILCHSCNVLLGHCRDDINILQTAIKYLRKDGDI